jgi:hypothetical protein
MQQMLFAGKAPLPVLTFQSAVEQEVGPSTNATIGAPTGTVSGDFQLLFAWQDTTLEPTLTENTGIGGSQWTKVGQQDLRPALGAWYSTTDTGSVTISGATAGSSGEDWNLIRMRFSSDKPINTVTVSVSDFERRVNSYSHQITPPTDGANYTYLHVFGLSGRPRNNLSEPASISRQPGNIDEPNKVINSDSDAVAYYEIYSPGETTLGTYTYNNINDSGQMSSVGLWIGFT